MSSWSCCGSLVQLIKETQFFHLQIIVSQKPLPLFDLYKEKHRTFLTFPETQTTTLAQLLEAS